MGKTHSDAKALCAEDGAKLAIAPYGQANIKAMEKYMAHLAAAWYIYLLDGNDAAGNDVWVLPDGERFKPEVHYGE